MHILPWQHKGHSVPDMFSCQPLVDFLNKEKGLLLSSREWAQWNMAQQDLTPCSAVTHGAHIRQTLLRITNLNAHTA